MSTPAPPEEVDVIVVTGSATANGAPDLVYFDFGVWVVKETAKEAFSVSERAIARILTKLRDLGFKDAKDTNQDESIPTLLTRAIDADARYERDYDRTAKLTGFKVARNYRAQMPAAEIKLAENAMKVVFDSGANDFSNLTWSLSTKNRAALKLQAMTDAQQAAKDKANLLAEQLGYKVGKLLGIDEGIERPIRVHFRSRASARSESSRASMAASSAQISTITGSQVSESAEVTLTFALISP